MKKITIAIAIFTVMAMVSGSAFAATTLTVEGIKAPAGGTADVKIMASQLEGIAGFAFTVKHEGLTVNATKGVTTVAIKKFTGADGLGYSSEDGLDSTSGKVIGTEYDTPLVANKETPGETKIAAAVPTALTGTTSTALCTITFDIPSTAKTGDKFTVTIVPTSLTNPAAGYETATPIDAVISVKDDGTYPVLLSATALTTAAPAGTVEVGTSYVRGEPTGTIDGITSLLDLNKALQLYKSSKTQSLDLNNMEYNACDVVTPQGNGKIDLLDLAEMLKLYKADKGK